jgi:1,4-dihydroxy-6-naphthoate synthase
MQADAPGGAKLPPISPSSCGRPSGRYVSVDMTIGYSPCPNDTFVFFGVASGRVAVPGVALHTQLSDVETLNKMAFRGAFEFSKLSFHAWLMLRNRYRLLNSGAALGYGCGPVLIARRPMTRRSVAAAKVVLPGQWTTAHMLFRLWLPEARRRVFVPYHRIFDYIQSGRADCGVIIHENRFTFEAAGFQSIIDLGQWWEQETGLPIPLGCIAARDDVPEAIVSRMEAAIRQSIALARCRPEAAMPYIRRHAQEMDDGVITRHIRTFVNAFTRDLGDTGRAAVRALEQHALAAGMLP